MRQQATTRARPVSRTKKSVPPGPSHASESPHIMLSLETLANDMASLRTKLARSQAQERRSLNHAGELSAKLDEANARRQELQDNIHSLVEERDAAVRSEQALHYSNEQLSKQVQQMVESADIERSRHDKAWKDLQQRFNTVQKRAQARQLRSEGAADTLDSLTKALKAMITTVCRNDMDGASAASDMSLVVADMERALTRLRGNATTTTDDDADGVLVSTNALAERCNMLSTERDNLRAELRREQGESSRLHALLPQYRNAIIKSRSDKTMLADRLTAANADRAALKNDNRELRQTIHEMQRKHSRRVDALAVSMKEKEDLSEYAYESSVDSPLDNDGAAEGMNVPMAMAAPEIQRERYDVREDRHRDALHDTGTFARENRAQASEAQDAIRRHKEEDDEREQRNVDLIAANRALGAQITQLQATISDLQETEKETLSHDERQNHDTQSSTSPSHSSSSSIRGHTDRIVESPSRSVQMTNAIPYVNSNNADDRSQQERQQATPSKKQRQTTTRPPPSPSSSSYRLPTTPQFPINRSAALPMDTPGAQTGAALRELGGGAVELEHGLQDIVREIEALQVQLSANDA